jgi:hypothetical protein
MPLATVADVLWDRLGACLVDVERIASMQPGVGEPHAVSVEQTKPPRTSGTGLLPKLSSRRTTINKTVV